MAAPTTTPADPSELLFRTRVVGILAIETTVLYGALSLFIDIQPFWVRLVIGFFALASLTTALAVRGRVIDNHLPGRVLIVAAMLCLSFASASITNLGLPVIIAYSIVSLTMAASLLDTYRAGLSVSALGVVLAVGLILYKSVNPLAACLVYLALTATSTFLLLRQRQFLEEARDVALNLALTDTLTGLLNRRGMDIQVPLLDALSTRNEQRLACILVDLDHFKQVNDVYGHATGDDVLKQTANTITGMLRPADIAVRTGGEEFAIFCLVHDEPDMMNIAERLRHAIAHQPSHPPLTASIGAALGDGSTPDTISALVAHADKALYAAKHSGRNTTRAA